MNQRETKLKFKFKKLMIIRQPKKSQIKLDFKDCHN